MAATGVHVKHNQDRRPTVQAFGVKTQEAAFAASRHCGPICVTLKATGPGHANSRLLARFETLGASVSHYRVTRFGRPSCRRCGSGCRPHAVRASLYIVGVWIRQPKELRMSKKKRRKPSKAEIRKAWSENRRRENRRKGAVEAEESRRAKYIASADPDEDIPWCKNCRAHYDTEMVWGYETETYSDGSTTSHRGQFRSDQCIQCNGQVVAPARSKSDENSFFFQLGALLLLVVTFVVGLLLDANKAVAIGLFITVAISISALGYCAYRGHLSPTYRSWLQWAKEHKDHETK